MAVQTTSQGGFRRVICLSTDTKPSPGVGAGYATLREADTSKEYYWNGTDWVQRSASTEFTDGGGGSNTESHITLVDSITAVAI